MLESPREMTRVVFMGTPEFALPSLEQLMSAAGCQVVGVYTQPDRPAGRHRVVVPPPVKTAALAYGLPVFQPERLRQPADIAALAELRPDVIVVAAFGQLLRPAVLAIPPKGVINVHPSLLPRHRGASPVAAAILAGDQQTGVTIMLMDPGLDTGPILSQQALPIDPLDTTGTLTTKLAQAGAKLLLQTLPLWLEDRITPQPQDDAQATYAPRIHKEEGLIDWQLSALEIWRRVRAYNPWPGAFTYVDGQLLHIWEAWPLPQDQNNSPGQTVPLRAQDIPGLPDIYANAGSIFGVQTGQGVLAVLRVQRAGRKALPTAEFLRGQRGFIGRRLG